MNGSSPHSRPASGLKALSIDLASVLIASVVLAAAVLPASNASAAAIGQAAATGDGECRLALSPYSADVSVGDLHALTATVVGPSGQPANQVPAPDGGCTEDDVAAFAGRPVTFEVQAGPNAGGIGAVVALGANGSATFAYSSSVPGLDELVASVDLSGSCEEPCASTAAIAGESAYATVAWHPAGTLAAGAATPRVSLPRFKRCVGRGLFRVVPEYSGGYVTAVTLLVDGRRLRTAGGATPFRLRGSSFRAGKHRVEIVATFGDGRVASDFATFKRCASRRR